MKIVRLAKGQNDFAIGNLSLGKLECIRRVFQQADTVRALTSLEQELKMHLEYFFEQHPKIDCFGDDLVGKIVSNK